MTLHPKIRELQARRDAINYSNFSVDGQGNFIGPDGEPLEMQEMDNRVQIDNNIIKGYCCVWNVKDDRGTVWIKGCFAKSIRDRGPDSNANYKVTGLWQHKACEPIGRITVLKEDKYGLYFELTLDEFDAVPLARRAASQVQSGTLNQFSFGFDYVWDKMEYDESRDAVLMMEAELFEISVVTIASMLDTYAIRSKEQYETIKTELDEEFDEFLKKVPRDQRVWARELFTRQHSLAANKPRELDTRSALEKRSKPDETSGESKFDLKQFLKAFE